MVMLTRRRFLASAAAGLAMAGLDLGVRAQAITINSRSSWAVDRPAKEPLPAEDVRFLIVHHSASRNGHTSADAPAILRSFYDFHTGPEKGWNDIAYNFLIDSEGVIWEGRAGSLDGPVAGDATGGNQGFTQLVCLIGDFNQARPTPASLSALVALLAWLADRYGVDTTPGAEVTFTSRGSNRWPAGSSVTTPTITGHKTMSQTTCPGANLDAYVVGSLMADVTVARGGILAAPTTTTAAPVSSVVATGSSATTAGTTATTVPVTTTIAAAHPTEPDPVPTGGASGSSLAALATTTVYSAEVPPVATSTTSLPAPAPAPTRSPLVLGAGAVAALATSLVLWRARRMYRE